MFPQTEEKLYLKKDRVNLNIPVNSFVQNHTPDLTEWIPCPEIHSKLSCLIKIAHVHATDFRGENPRLRDSFRRGSRPGPVLGAGGASSTEPS